MENQVKFSKKLKAIQKQRKISVEAIAEYIGRSKYTVYQYRVSDEMPPYPVLVKLSELFEVDIEYFYKESYVIQPTAVDKSNESLSLLNAKIKMLQSYIEVLKLFIKQHIPETEIPNFNEGTGTGKVIKLPFQVPQEHEIAA